MANTIYSRLYSRVYAVGFVLSATEGAFTETGVSAALNYGYSLDATTPLVYSRIYSRLFARYPTFLETGNAVGPSILLFYNSVAAAPMLLRTGTSYTLVAKDQSGNVLDGTVGVWSSTDGTNAPINSLTGVISPSALCKATFTYTHTASGLAGTVTATVLPAATVLVSDTYAASHYAIDSDFRANIRSSVTTGYHTPPPTGGAGALYGDGVDEGRATLDATTLYNGDQSLLMSFPGGDNSAATLRAGFPGGALLSRIWVFVPKRYNSGFTPDGTNGGTNGASYKDGPFIGWGNGTGQGRAAVLYTNTTRLAAEALTQAGGGSTGGVDETNIGTVTTEWTSEDWLGDIILYEGKCNLMRIRGWRFYLGTHPITDAISGTPFDISGPMNVGVAVGLGNLVSPLGEVYNRVRGASQDMYKNVGDWEAVDGEVYGDPYSILNDSSTPTLTGISGGTIAHGTNGATITLTGTNFTTNCFLTFSNAGVLLQSLPVISGGGTTMTLTVNVTSGASTGAGTVSITNYSSQQTTGTQVVTIT